MAAIKIENLCKTFEYYEKGQGLQGSVRNKMRDIGSNDNADPAGTKD